MKQFQIEAEDEPTARTKLATQLGVTEADLRCVQNRGHAFTFEAVNLPPRVELEVSRDKMKVKLRKVQMPVGDKAPKLTTDFVVSELKKIGVVHGIKHEVITDELFRICSQEKFDEKKPLNVVVAEGQAPLAAQAGRPQWVLDLRLFKKSKPVFARSGEIVARAPIAVKGKEGVNVFGEKIAFSTEDPFRLPIGKGIKTVQQGQEVVYVTETCGQLFLDQGVRLRLEAKVHDLDDGLRAGVEISESSFSGAKFKPEDLIESAKANGVVFGFLSPQEILSEIKATKKWPAIITVARGEEPVNAKPGEVELLYQRPKSNNLIDIEKSKLGIVFPNEIIARINHPSEPKDGKTVFGETLRGRPYTELPLYPGRNIQREREGNADVFRSRIYGRVQLEKDRIHVENILEISEDALEASIDLFPQNQLQYEDLLFLLRDKDVLFGYDKDKLELELQQVHRSGKRNRLVVARARGFTPGKNARLRYYFKPDDMKSKGVFVKSSPRPILAAPGDLLLVKTLPLEALDGVNLFREKIPAPKEVQAVDVEIKAGKFISEKEVGEYGSDTDPARIEYRATSFGIVQWKNRELSLLPVVEIGEKEEYFKMKIAPRSEFGTPITYEMIEKFAKDEGVKVDLEKSQITKALRTPLNSDQLHEVVIAKAIPARNGSDAKIEYLVEFNGEPIANYLQSQKSESVEPRFCDCVRPKEVIGLKTPAGPGTDGRTVFGRRIIAERGNDDPWLIGWGIERSLDGNSISIANSAYGFIFVEDRRITVRDTIKISPDKMSASMWIYPSKSARFQPREDKIMGMLQAKSVIAGIKVDDIRNAIAEVQATMEPKELIVAEGVPAGVGRNAQYRLAFEIDELPGTLRKDGSIDYKAGSVFQMVRAGQLLMVKQEATQGPDGFNVLDERIPGQFGKDQKMLAGPGVEVSSNGLEFYASIDGILELTENSIRVIEGLLIPGDVDYSTGSIDAGAAKVLIRGSVLPGFSVSSESDIVIDQVAEACRLESKSDIKVNGGIIGKDVGYIRAEGKVEALYINSGAVVEAKADIITGNEILNSKVRSGGFVICDRGAGTISGGEIWAFEGIRAKVLGAPGAETPTKIYLGVNYLEMQAALQRIEEEGLNSKEEELSAEISNMDKELKLIYDQVPAASDHEESARLQSQYKELYEYRRQAESDLETVRKQKEAILNRVSRNKNFVLTLTGTAHPGVVLIYKDAEWELKEPLKSVQVTWNEGSSNFVIQRV